MNTLLIYMIKVAIYIAGFYIVYSAFLSRDTLYFRNRLFIMSSVLTSFFLPLININVGENGIGYFGRMLSEILIDGNNGNKIKEASAASGFISSSLIIKIYFSGVILSGLKLLIDIISLLVLFARQKGKDHIIYFKGLGTAGFSALGHIFINKNLTRDEAEGIILHEQNHLNQNHFFDILFIEVVQAIQWFNPIIYLYNRSLRAVHEYQADSECLKTGLQLSRYQTLLFNHAFRNYKFSLNNSFSNPSLIKKRMIMMTKKRTIAMANLKILLVLPVTIFLVVLISSCSKSSPNAATDSPTGMKKKMQVVQVAEVMPKFPGGDEALIKFIMSNVAYPEAAKVKGITGKVIVEFIVSDEGKVLNAHVSQPADPDLDAEALRVVNLTQKWEPGLVKGKPVNVSYSLPINFSLK